MNKQCIQLEKSRGVPLSVLELKTSNIKWPEERLVVKYCRLELKKKPLKNIAVKKNTNNKRFWGNCEN